MRDETQLSSWENAPPVTKPTMSSALIVIFRKELIIQGRSAFTLVTRMVIGPLVSFATTGILYGAFFRINPSSELGKLHNANFLSFVAFGFMTHTFLNSGYYAYSYRIINEAWKRTLGGIWLSPFPRLLGFLSLASVEFFRGILVLTITTLIVRHPAGSWLSSWLAMFAAFLFLSPFCVALGLLRSAFQLLWPSLSDMADHAYLGFTLTACFYIPVEILPIAIQPLCYLNPAFYVAQIFRALWAHGKIESSTLLSLLSLLGLYGGLALIVWRKLHRRFLEALFS